MKPDQLDYAILSELRNNCRMAYKNLSEKTGSNINTVASRIKKLEKTGYIKGYCTSIDYSKIGFNTSALVRAIMDNADSLNQKDLEGIISMPSTVLTYGMTGKYDVNIVVNTKNFSELVERIGQIGKNRHITNMKSEFIIKEYIYMEDFNPFSPSRAKQGPAKIRRKPISELDLGILREIRHGANKPLREFSAALDAPISTIKERMDRMEAEGIIKKYVADVNFPLLGYTGFGAISIKLKGDRINDESVVTEILKMPEVGTLFRTLGSYDLLAGILSKDVDGIMNGAKKISDISGVLKIDSEISLSNLKSRMRYNPLSEFRMEHEK